MQKIKEIIIGTNNPGKYKEICDLLPKKLKKYSANELNIQSPKETGKSFEENSLIKASYYSKKTNLVCLSDDSGLEINLLNGEPGIFSSRWGGEEKNFNLAMKKVFLEMKKKKNDWLNYNEARFICCLTIFWPSGENFTSKGIVDGKISEKIKGNKGFGYDPIFIPNGHSKTFGEMEPNLKMSMDHRNEAFLKIKKFFD